MRTFTCISPAAPYAATDEPPLPELSSNTDETPCCLSIDSITDVPRSLNDPVGANHSSLKKHFAPANVVAISGVQPSPNEIGVSTSSGSDARYLQIDRVARSTSSRFMPRRGVSINGSPDGDRQIGVSNRQVSLLRDTTYCAIPGFP